MITLITGGIKSGKSAYALKLISTLPEFSLGKGLFIATADSGDKSLENKILAHQVERKNLPLVTLEEKLELSHALRNINSETKYVIIDCLTLWLGNLMYLVQDPDGRKNKVENFLQTLFEINIPVFIVTNEVGLGIIPENKLARQYQDELGNLNRRTAEISGRVILMVSGIPLVVK